MNLEIPTYILNSKDYRTIIPITMNEEDINHKIDTFRKSPSELESPIVGSIIIDIRKSNYIYKNQNIFGIIIDTINIRNIIKDLGIKENKSFYVKLKNIKGDIDSKCILTNQDIPFEFYYDGKGNISNL